MQLFDRQPERHDVHDWLSSIVTGVVEASGVIQLDREDLWTFLDGLPVALLIATDRACSQIVGNRTAQAMLHVPHGENLSQSAPEGERPGFKVYSDGQLVDPADLPMQRAAATGCPVEKSECEIVFDAGGSMFIAGYSIPIHDAQGVVCGSLGAFVDITERWKNCERSAMVAREMAHRVKNTVALIQALAHGSIRQKLGHDDYVDFEQRLISIARAQEMMADPARGAVGLSELIAETVEGVFQGGTEQILMRGAPVNLVGNNAVTLGMVFHELATNARKYGGLRSDSGSIAIAWSIEQKDNRQQVDLTWTEQAAGVPAAGVAGFGTRLIQGSVRSLADGRFKADYTPSGLIARLAFSIPA